MHTKINMVWLSVIMMMIMMTAFNNVETTPVVLQQQGAASETEKGIYLSEPISIPKGLSKDDEKHQAAEFDDLNSNVYFSSAIFSPNGGGTNTHTIGSSSVYAFCSIAYHLMDSTGIDGLTGSADASCYTFLSSGTWYLQAIHTSSVADIVCQAVCIRQTAWNTTRSAYQYPASISSGAVSVPVQDCYLTRILLGTDHEYHCSGLCNGCDITATSLRAIEDGSNHHTTCGSYCANQGMISYTPISSLRGHDGGVTQSFSGDYDICFLSYIYRGDGSCRFGCADTYNYCRLSYSTSAGWSLTAYSGDPSSTYDIICGVRCLNAV